MAGRPRARRIRHVAGDVATWIDQVGEARRHLEASGLSPRLVSALLALWVDQVERQAEGDRAGVTFKDWLFMAAPGSGQEEPGRTGAELKAALPKMLRAGLIVRERHPGQSNTYRLLMPAKFQGCRNPDYCI